MSQASCSSADLPLVLDQAQLVGDAGQVLVRGEVAGLAVVVERRQVLDVADLDAERVGDLLRRRAAPGPQLAVLAVAEELVGVALGARAGVEDGLAVVDDQHGVGGLVAGEVGVGGVGAEAVVGVVGAHLVGAGRQHQPLAGERLGELRAARGGPVGDRVPRQLELALAPALAHEGGVGGGHRGVVRLGLRLGSPLAAVVSARVSAGVSEVGSLTRSLYAAERARAGRSDVRP